jgi:hypothetical protein
VSLPPSPTSRRSSKGQAGFLTILTVFDRVLYQGIVTDGSFVNYRNSEDVEREGQSWSMVGNRVREGSCVEQRNFEEFGSLT